MGARGLCIHSPPPDADESFCLFVCLLLLVLLCIHYFRSHFVGFIYSSAGSFVSSVATEVVYIFRDIREWIMKTRVRKVL